MKMLFIDNKPINITFNSFITRKNSISYICYSNKDLIKRHSLLLNIRKLVNSLANEVKQYIDYNRHFNVFTVKDVYNDDLKTYLQMDPSIFYIAYGKSKNIDFYNTDIKELYKGLRSYSFKLRDEIEHVFGLYSNLLEDRHSYLM